MGHSSQREESLQVAALQRETAIVDVVSGSLNPNADCHSDDEYFWVQSKPKDAVFDGNRAIGPGKLPPPATEVAPHRTA
jgi:hypothetical protein